MIVVGGEELKWLQLKHNQLMSLQGPYFSPCSTAKTNDKSSNLRKKWHLLVQVSEKTHLKKLMMMMMKMIIIIVSIMNCSQEMTVFHGRQKLTSAVKQRPEKLW